MNGRGDPVKSVKGWLMITTVTAAFVLISAWPALAQAPVCVQMLNKVLCPPPNGGVTQDLSGKVVCGPGMCARGSDGKVKCASVPGGAVAMDLYGDVICVGGCVDGKESECVEPKP